jgi:hypothetical protein
VTAAACRPSQVKVALAHVVVGLGHVGGFLGFTNISSATCRLAGWPNVAGIEPDGAVSVARHALRIAFGPDNLTGAPVIVLKPGASAVAAFAGSDVAGLSGRCPPAYRYLRVTPPGMTITVQLSAWLADFGQYMPSCFGLRVLPLRPSTVMGQ